MEEESKVVQVLRSLLTDRMVTSGLRVFRKFCACGRQSEFLCDWKVREHKTGTCDNPICSVHAKQVGPGKYLCPEHQRLYDNWKSKRKEPASLADQGSLFDVA